MSNILEKLFITERVLIPGYTIRRFVPAVTTTTTRFYGFTQPYQVYSLSESGPTILNFPGGIKTYAPSGPLGSSFNVFLGFNVIGNQYQNITVVGVETTTTTVPGYFTYDTSPDTYQTTYHPNLGWNSSARSVASALGDCTASFSVRVDAVGVVAGLNEVTDSSGSDYFEISYGINFFSGSYRVIEQSVIKTGAFPFIDTDVFSVSRSVDVITYLKNGAVFYTSSASSSEELLLDASLYAGGDAINDASFILSSSIELRTASLSATSTLEASPKPAADLSASSSLLHSGTYSIDNDVFVSNTPISASSEMQVQKEFGEAALSATATLSSAYTVTQGVSASFGAMTAFATSGYAAYAEIVASFEPLTVQAGAGAVSLQPSFIAAEFEGLTANIISLVGGTTVSPSQTDFSPMTAFAVGINHLETIASPVMMTATSSLDVITTIGSASLQAESSLVHSGIYSLNDDVYVTGQVISGATSLEVNPFVSSLDVNATSILTFVGPYTASGGPYSYAEINGTLGSMTASLGDFPPLGNFGYVEFISTSLEGTGTTITLPEHSLEFASFTMAALGGANLTTAAPVFGLSGTGTFLDTGTSALPFFTSTLSATGTRIYNGDGILPFISSALTGLGGGIANALSAPTFTMSGEGINLPTGSAALPFLSFSFSGTGHIEESGSASLPFLDFSLINADARLDWFVSSITGTGHTGTEADTGADLSLAVAYVLNVHTSESTRYSNYPFMHVITIGGRPYGVRPEGLYLLEGSVDYDSTPKGKEINGTIVSKETDYGTFNDKRVPKIYLNTDTLTTTTPFVDGLEGPSYDSEFTGRKTNLGRGLVGRYWRFKIEHIQKLEGLEFLPEVIQRRVK